MNPSFQNQLLETESSLSKQRQIDWMNPRDIIQ